MSRTFLETKFVLGIRSNVEVPKGPVMSGHTVVGSKRHKHVWVIVIRVTYTAQHHAYIEPTGAGAFSVGGNFVAGGPRMDDGDGRTEECGFFEIGDILHMQLKNVPTPH